MRKAKNVFSIISIVFAVLSAAALMLFPILFGILPPQVAPAVGADIIPVNQLIIPKDLFDFNSIIAFFQDFSLAKITALKFAEWFRLGALLVLVILAIFFLVWLIMILVKGKPSQLIWWLLLAAVICVAVDVISIALMTGTPVTNSSEPFEFECSGLSTEFTSTIAFTLFVLASQTEQFFLPVINPILCWVELAAIALAALALIFGIIALSISMAWVKRVQRVKPEEEAAPAEAQQPAEVVAEQQQSPVAVEPNEDGAYKLVRRILVHKSGKVIRVLNEQFYDVTTNIYVDPAYAEPLDPNETEQIHYEKLINATGLVEQPKPAAPKAPVKKPAAPVVEEQPAPVVEEPASVEYERITFQERVKKADSTTKKIYNELKSEILSYGVKSRVSFSGDTFRLHKKTYIKMVIAGKNVKLYMALNPKDYKDSPIPFDASKKNAYKEIPFVFKARSDLSVRRAKKLIADTMAKDKLVQGEVKKHNWAKDIQ